MEGEMKTSMQRVRTIDLVQDQMLVIDGDRAGSLRVLRGAAWLTDEGEAADRVVHAGAEVALGRGRVLIEALGPARVQLAEAAMPWSGAWQRLRRGLRRFASRGQLGPVAVEGCS
jgi:hypothetical protein